MTSHMAHDKENVINKMKVMTEQNASKHLSVKRITPSKKDEPQLDILKAMETNMHFQMTYFAKNVDSMELLFQPDVTVVRSTLMDDTFNYILSARFSETNIQNRVVETLKPFREKSWPYSWWISPSDTPMTLSDVLLAEGLQFKEENIGMYLQLSDCLPSQLKTILNFQKVRSLEHLKEFSQVILNIGGNPEAFDKIYSQLTPILSQNRSDFEMHVAYLDHIPIVTGILVLHANVAGIYYVATVPDQRKKGYGTAMMKYLIERAKDQGYDMITLQASKEGKALYQRLGFEEVCVFKEYAEGNSNL